MTSSTHEGDKRKKLIRTGVVVLVSAVLFISTACRPLNQDVEGNGTQVEQPDQGTMDPTQVSDYNSSMDLSIMYEDMDAWRAEFEDVKARCKELGSASEVLEGFATGSGERLKEMILLRDELERRHDKLTVYAMLLRDSDSANQEARDIYQLAISERSNVNSVTTEFDDAMYGLDKGILKKTIASWREGPEKAFVEEVLKTDYEPNEEANAIRSAAGAISESPEDIFYAYLYPQEDAGNSDSNEQLTPVTPIAPIGDYYSKDPLERKKAYDAEKKRTYAGKDVLGAALAAEVAMNYFEARAYGYDTAKQSALDQDGLTEGAYKIILERPYGKRALYQRYLNHLKGQLHVEKLRYYDRTMEPDYSMPEYPLSEVRELLHKGLKPLGDKYLNVIDEAFDNRWLDLGFREGKYEGAYTLAAYDANPFIIMTYEDDLASVATLGHELGHLVNDVMTNTSQPFRNAVITSLKAEMASTTNEVLIYDHLLESTQDVELRKGILKSYIDFINDAYFYQTALARFQDGIHEDYGQGLPLSATAFDERLGDELSMLYGDAYAVESFDRVAWAEINHLYWGYYVYKYPLGAAVGFHNAEAIALGDKAFLENYTQFLSSGTSRTLEEDMTSLGIDLESGDYFKAIEKKYEALVNEYISLTNH